MSGKSQMRSFVKRKISNAHYKIKITTSLNIVQNWTSYLATQYLLLGTPQVLTPNLYIKNVYF
jgi:hypothetical protein